MNPKEIVGNIRESKNSGYYKIIKYLGKKDVHWYKIKFLKTNYKKEVRRNQILINSIKDRFYPSVYNVGYLGHKKRKNNLKLYKKWENMLKRCYNKNSDSYKSYGNKGITVCKRWHNFSNFVKDVKELKNYDENKLKKGEIQLDKDKKQQDIKLKNMIYSKSTCVWLSKKENDSINPSVQNKFKAISPDGNIYISYNQRKFAREHDLDRSRISYYLNNERKYYKGWKFEFIE